MILFYSSKTQITRIFENYNFLNYKPITYLLTYNVPQLGSLYRLEEPDFNMFFETFTKAIDKSCKLTIPKSTIRNVINNLWITDAVINSIEEKIRVINHSKK